LIKDYDVRINYHSRKVNVIADALSHKKYCNAKAELRQEFGYLNMEMVNETVTTVEMEPTLEAEIRKAQMEDGKLKEI
jgi:hypothetical protein